LQSPDRLPLDIIPEPIIDSALVEETQDDSVADVGRVSRLDSAAPLAAVASTLGKRNPVNRSPIKKSATRSSKQWKVMTSDEVARLEAEKYMQKGKQIRRAKKRD
jgi:hypothetical protein